MATKGISMAKNQIVGGNFQDSEGNVLAFGSVEFVLSQDEAIYTALSPIVLAGEVAAGIPISVALDGTGNVPVSPAVYLWPNDQLVPAGSTYSVTAFNQYGARVWGPYPFPIPSSPDPFNLEYLVPPGGNTGSNTNITINVNQGGVNNMPAGK